MICHPGVVAAGGPWSLSIIPRCRPMGRNSGDKRMACGLLQDNDGMSTGTFHVLSWVEAFEQSLFALVEMVPFDEEGNIAGRELRHLEVR